MFNLNGTHLILTAFFTVFVVLARSEENVSHISSLGLELKLIKSGTFVMGSPHSESGRGEDENQVEVTITEPFYLSVTEVTQEQWMELMGTTLEEQIRSQDGPAGRGAKLVAKPSAEGPLQPMCFVSWTDAMSFCRKLTAKEKENLPSGYSYSLPTEAQWEYACRAGTLTATAFGNQLSSKQANFYGLSPYGGADKGPYLESTAEVGSYSANKWGLHDMHGNVYEWCLDWYSDRLGGGVDPIVEAEREARVIRGGTWNRVGSSCRSAYRYSAYPYTRSYNIGFRVALTKGIR